MRRFPANAEVPPGMLLRATIISYSLKISDTLKLELNDTAWPVGAVYALWTAAPTVRQSRFVQPRRSSAVILGRQLIPAAAEWCPTSGARAAAERAVSVLPVCLNTPSPLPVPSSAYRFSATRPAGEIPACGTAYTADRPSLIQCRTAADPLRQPATVRIDSEQRRVVFGQQTFSSSAVINADQAIQRIAALRRSCRDPEAHQIGIANRSPAAPPSRPMVRFG